MVSCVWQLKCIIPNENEISDLEIHLSSINNIWMQTAQYMSIRYDVISIFSEGVMWFCWWNRNIVVSSLSLCVCVFFFSMNWNMSTKFILFNERNSFVCKCKSILLPATSDYYLFEHSKEKKLKHRFFLNNKTKIDLMYFYLLLQEKWYLSGYGFFLISYHSSSFWYGISILQFDNKTL